MLDLQGWGTGATNGSLQDIFDAAANGSASPSLGEQRGPMTVTMDAISSAQPIARPGFGDQFAGVWPSLSGVLGTVTQTELARYQAKRALPPQAAPAQAPAGATPTKNNTMIYVGGALLLGVVVFLALRR